MQLCLVKFSMEKLNDLISKHDRKRFRSPFFEKSRHVSFHGRSIEKPPRPYLLRAAGGAGGGGKNRDARPQYPEIPSNTRNKSVCVFTDSRLFKRHAILRPR